MAGFGEDLLEILDDTRQILGPDDLDLRPTAVVIITRRWPSGSRGKGAPVDTLLALPNWTKVRHISQREINGSGGSFEQGDVMVGPVTPRYDSDGMPSGGLDASDLAPEPPEPSAEVIYRLTSQVRAGGIVGDYSRLQLRRDRRLRFMLVVGRDRTTPGP